MRWLVVLSAVAAALAIAPSASPGGWATVGFEPLPDGMSAGGTWSPTIFVKQHGVTPLAGLTPVVDIYDDQTGAATTFIATETSDVGVYTADVVFPAQGDWRVTIHSGFGDSQVSYGPVAIGPPSTGDGGSRDLPVVGLGVVALALLGGALLLGARRLRRLTPASG
jgi:LPXTG-motif cell wall-anchored protein